MISAYPQKEGGALPSDRAGGATPPSRDASRPKALIPSAVAKKLTEAQRRYLRELEPNQLPGDWRDLIARKFQNRAFRSSIKGGKLSSAHAKAMHSIVVQRGAEHPIECGWHYASLTPLGLAVRDFLLENTDGPA